MNALIVRPLVAAPQGIPDPTPLWLAVAAIAGATILVGLGVLIVHRASGSGFRVTPATLFILYYVVFIFVGGAALVAVRGEGAYFHFAGARNYLFLLTVGAAPLAFAGGVLLANRWARLRPVAELEAHWRRPWSDQPPDRAFVVRFGVLAVACLAVSAAVLTLGPPPPLLYLLTHMGSRTYSFDLSLDLVRLKYLSPHAGGLPFQATLYQFYGNLMPMLSLVAFGLASRLRDRRWLLVGTGLLGASFFMAAVTLTKNPVENLLVLVAIAWLWFGRRTPGVWQVSGLAGVTLGAFFAIVVVTNRSASFGQIVWATVRRLLLVQAQVLYSIFELIPARLAYLGGGGLWMDLRNLRPGPKSTLDFGTWLYSVIVSSAPGFGGVGSAPTIFFGQLYADFGVIAALLGMVAVGCLAQVAYVWYLRRPRTIVTWCVFAGLTASIPRLTTSSIISIGVQYGIAASILFGLYFADWGALARGLMRGRLPSPGRSLPEPDRGMG